MNAKQIVDGGFLCFLSASFFLYLIGHEFFIEMRFKNHFLLLLTLLLAIEVCAQKPYADSLKKILASTTDLKARVDLKCEIAYDLFEYEDSIAIIYAEQARLDAEKARYTGGLKRALTLLGLGEYNAGKFDEALRYLRSSDNLHADISSGLIGYNLMLIGSIFRDQAHFDSAQFYYKKAVDVIGPQGDSYFLAACYQNLALIEIIWWQNDNAFLHLKKAEDLALRTPKDFYTALSVWSIFVRYYIQMNDYEKATEYMNRLCDKSVVMKDYFHQISCLSWQAEIDAHNGLYRIALNKAFKALRTTDVFKHPQQRVIIYQQIGNIYNELSEYVLASEYLFEGLKISERLGFRYETARMYTDLAWVFKEQLNFSLALEYVGKSEKLRTEMNDKAGLAFTKNIRGLILFLQKDYEESLREFEASLQIRKTLGNKTGVAAVIFNKSLIYQDLHNYEKAYELQKESLAIDELIANKQEISISYNAMAELLIKMKRPKEAEIYLQKALKLAEATNSKLMRRNIYRNYSRLKEANGNLSAALEFDRKSIEMNDSIFTEKGSSQLAEMETFYKLEQKEQQLKEIDQIKNQREQELAVQKELAQRQRIIIGISAFAIVLLVLSGIVGIQYYNAKSEVNKQLKRLNKDILEQKEEIQAQSEELLTASNTISSINKQLEAKIEERTYELKQAYKELDTFFYRSSHDFRRPITTFLGLAGVAAITVKDPVSLELFEKVKETASSLDKMLQKLQSISDLGAQQMVFKEVFLKELMDEVLDSFRESIQQKKITVNADIVEKSTFISYPALVKLIFENLVENSIHFSGFDSPFIKIEIKLDDQQMELVVEDNGQGIQEEYQPRIFEMYFRANERSKGNGLGLYISKKAVERLNGWIGFSSEHNKGSVFVIRIPNTTP